MNKVAFNVQDTIHISPAGPKRACRRFCQSLENNKLNGLRMFRSWEKYRIVILNSCENWKTSDELASITTKTLSMTLATDKSQKVY